MSLPAGARGVNTLHLIADDLTGALDAAIAFASDTAPIPVYLRAPEAGMAESLAIDSGTRDLDAATARRTVAHLAAQLPPLAAGHLFLKLDSLLRGHAAHELAGWRDAAPVARCIIAPAFPHYGRITRDGVQMLRTPQGERPVGARLAEELAALGLPVQKARPGDDVPDGISLWDAETDADLARIVAAGTVRPGSTLWCGSGGLARALAGGNETPRIDAAQLPRPVLGLFGTDHPTTRAQIAACPDIALVLADGGSESAARLAGQMASAGRVLVSLDLPDGTAREAAAQAIAVEYARLLAALPPPGTLVVSGGETLRALCLALRAERLDLFGEFETGVPCSVLRGGRFDGVRVISKSGAFGDPLLLRRLMFSSEGERA